MLLRLAAAAVVALGGAQAQAEATTVLGAAAAQQGACAPGAFWDASAATCSSCLTSRYGYAAPTGPQNGTLRLGKSTYFVSNPSLSLRACWELCNTTFLCGGDDGKPTLNCSLCGHPESCALCDGFDFKDVGCQEAKQDPSCYMMSSIVSLQIDACTVSGLQARSNSFSYGSSGACSPCAAGSSFLSSSSGCRPDALYWATTTNGDPVFFFSGSRTESAGAFAVTQPEGISYVVDHNGNENGAMSLLAGTVLTAAPLALLPSGSDKTRSISAWLRCPAAPAGSEDVGLFSFGSASGNSPRFFIYGASNGTSNRILPPVFGDSYRSTVSTYAGNGTDGFADGPAASAMFTSEGFGLGFIALHESSGILYVCAAENRRVRTVSPTGDVTTLAGNGSRMSADGVGTAASFGWVHAICVGTIEAVIFVTDSEDVGCNCLRRIEISTGAVTTVAGGVQGYADGVGSNAQFALPYGLAQDKSGTIFIAEDVDYKFTGRSHLRLVTQNYTVSTLVTFPQNIRLRSIALDNLEE